jgi:hypothetical protein
MVTTFDPYLRVYEMQADYTLALTDELKVERKSEFYDLYAYFLFKERLIKFSQIFLIPTRSYLLPVTQSSGQYICDPQRINLYGWNTITL